MCRTFSLFVGWRYSRSKRSNHFISFISLTSMLGIALGVMVLITVLSVMNGFSVDIRHKMLSYSPHIVLRSIDGNLRAWNGLVAQIEREPGVVGAAPYIISQGMLVTNGVAQPALVRGVDPAISEGIYPFGTNVVSGDAGKLAQVKFSVVLGQGLAENLGVRVGDKVTLLIPQAGVGVAGLEPKFKRLEVIAIFRTGSVYDDRNAFVYLGDADKLFQMHGDVSGIQVKVADELAAPQIARRISREVGGSYWVYDWTTDFATFFEALNMEKTVMWCILCLIIAVAAFNLVSSLVMMVADKRSDIAILRTMGATAQQVMGIFVTQGAIVGLIGTTLGCMGGLLLAYNITGLADYVQQLLNVKFVSEDVYLIGHVPSLIRLSDVVMICIFALVMSLLATLYPAWRAARISPAEALRYE